MSMPVIPLFTYSMPTCNGIDVQMARIPVPQGKTEEAKQIVEYYNAKLKTIVKHDLSL